MAIAPLAFSQLATTGVSADPRAELDRLRKLKRLKELEAKASGAPAPSAPQPAQPSPQPAGQSVNPMEQMGRDAQAVAHSAGGSSRPESAQADYKSVAAGAQVNPMVAMGQEAQRVWAETQQDPTRMAAMGYVRDPLSKSGWAKPRAETPIVNNPSDNNLLTDIGRSIAAPFQQNENLRAVAGAPLNFGDGLARGGANIINNGLAIGTEAANAGLNQLDPSRQQFTAPRIDVPQNAIVGEGGFLNSEAGVVPNIAGQIMAARVPLGRVSPGGGVANLAAKDALAMALTTDAKAPHVSDMIPRTGMGAALDPLRSNENDPTIVSMMKNLGEDLIFSGAGEATLTGVAKATEAGKKLLSQPAVPPTAPRPTNALASPPAPAQAAAAAQPSVGPSAQAGTAGTGQQAGPVPFGGQPVLNATPTTPPVSPALPNSDRKIIGRLLRAGGVPRNDVDRLLTGLVNAHQSSNSSRLPLAFFAEEYLPTQLPKQVADDVIQKLRGFGRERSGANSPKDPSRTIVRSTINELRGSQREHLTSQFENLLGKETLMTQQGKIARDKSGVAEAVYAEELGRQQRLIDDGKASPEQLAARDDLLLYIGRKDVFDEVPREIKLKAADQGKNLWEYIHLNPLEAAHWMQSELGFLARKGDSIAQAMRMPIVRRLEEAVPGYRGARMEYGDLSGQQSALEFGDDLYRVAANKFQTDEKALEFRKLSKAQKTVARKSIRDKLLNEFRKAKTGDDQAAVITQMQKDGVLDALESILGPEGKKVSDAIRTMVKENERLRAVDLLSGSNTADNLAQMQAAREAVRSPVNKAIGAVGDEGSYARTIFADAVSVALGLPPVWTAGKLGTAGIGRLGAPSKGKLASATRTLYEIPQPRNALAADAPRSPRAGGPPRTRPPAPAVTQESLDALLKQYDATPTPTLRNKIIAARKKLDAQQVAAPAPRPPPVQNGFFGGGRKPPGAPSSPSTVSPLKPAPKPTQNGLGSTLPMDEGAATGVGVAGGAVAGGALAPDTNKDGKVDAQERMAGAFGGAVSLGVAGNILGKAAGAGNRLGAGMRRGAKGPPSVRGADQASASGAPRTPKEEWGRGYQVFDAAHATSANFDAFDAAKIGRSDPGWNGRGHYFKQVDDYFRKTHRGDSPGFSYGQIERDGSLKDGARSLPVSIRMKKPFTKADADNEKIAAAFEKAGYRAIARDFETGKVRRILAPGQRSDFDITKSGRSRQSPDDVKAAMPDDAHKFSEVATKLGYDGANWNGELVVFPGFENNIRGKFAKYDADKSDSPIIMNGFGAARKATPPNKLSGPQKTGSGVLGNLAKRAAVGAATGAAVNLANDAGAQDDITGKISATEQSIAGINKSLADFEKLNPAQKQQLLKDAGYYAGKIDSNIAGKTTEAIQKWKADKAAALDKAEGDLTELVRRNAYQKNHPDAVMAAIREYAPTVAFAGAMLGLKFMRGSAAKASVRTAEVASNKLNRLITKGPVTGFLNKADTSRPANLNTLWQKGGASKDELPFKQDNSGKWKPNTNAKPAEELFSDNGVWQAITKYVKGKDLAIILGGGADIAYTQTMIDKSNKELADAEAEWNASPSDETFKRVEDAKNAVFAYTFAQRIGQGIVGGRILGSLGAGYAKVRPNIPAASTEQAALKQYIAGSKAPPKPRAPKLSVVPPSTQLPLPFGGKGNGKKP